MERRAMRTHTQEPLSLLRFATPATLAAELLSQAFAEIIRRIGAGDPSPRWSRTIALGCMHPVPAISANVTVAPVVSNGRISDVSIFAMISASPTVPLDEETAASLSEPFHTTYSGTCFRTFADHLFEIRAKEASRTFSEDEAKLYCERRAREVRGGGCHYEIYVAELYSTLACVLKRCTPEVAQKLAQEYDVPAPGDEQALTAMSEALSECYAEIRANQL